MKKILIFWGLTVVVCIVLTLLTAKVETPFDGNDIYGFPFTFYKVYGGKRTHYPSNEFSIVKLVLDIFIAILISLISIMIIKKFKTSFKSRK